jgi:hypothetical protein
MARITFLNFGVLNQMFFEMEENEAMEEFWGIFGSDHVLRNTGGIRIVHVGQAIDSKDRGGFQIGNEMQEVA